MINIVVPMAGAGSRFVIEGFNKPKPFIDINGKTMIERVLDGLQYDGAHYILIIQEAFQKHYSDTLQYISKNYPVQFISVNGMTMGAACTALSAHAYIYDNTPVIFADCDNIFQSGTVEKLFSDAQSRNIQGSLLTFNSSDDCYSYALVDKRGHVINTREKEVISSHAIAGLYYFSQGRDFVACAIDMMIYGGVTKNEYFMSNVYNYSYKRGMITGIYEIENNTWSCVGTPKQLKEFI
ncbi:MAG: glycosyltransferase family 2 protein [Rickettsiaceae bacterium]|nr:glycosyltransferase family 2 protein [Rickettsiaceae bacterium]MDP5083156.1 glycosyltransferase family 2 protein [Rickettsiaceae bacterium]